MANETPPPIRHPGTLGSASRRQQRVEDARQRFYHAMGHPPQIPALKALADQLQQQGHHADAETVLARLAALQPEEVRWQTGLAAVCHHTGNHRKAVKHLLRAAALRPGDAPIRSNLGYVLYLLGQYAEAERWCRNALALSPELQEATLNLGIILLARNRKEAAYDLFRALVEKHPDNARGWSNFAILLLHRGRPTGAVDAARRALALNPDFIEAHCNLGMALQENLQPREALLSYEKALTLGGGHPAARANRLMCTQYIDGFGSKALREMAIASWPATVNAPAPVRRVAPRSGKLRIGYMSGDFGRHPVGWFLLPVLRAHDRNRYRIFCYATGGAPDDITDAIKAACDGWRHVHRAADGEIADAIRDDEIDVLVDLAGHTAGNRLGVFQRRPAPVQVSWLGYFASTGLSSMDYVFLCKDQAPPGSASFFRERLHRLDPCQFCYQPPKYSPPVAPPPRLSRGVITFGCFNNTAKLNLPVLSLWCRILVEIPKSRLLLKWRSLADAGLRQRLLGLFGMFGIGGDRISFRGASPHRRMLEEYGDVDIALDPFPFNGGLTTCESLWMGVPVVTMAQCRPVSRQSLSILNRAGLSDLVATTPDEYLAIAKGLAGSAQRLDALRKKLRSRLDTDRPHHARALAEALEKGFSKVSGRI